MKNNNWAMGMAKLKLRQMKQTESDCHSKYLKWISKNWDLPKLAKCLLPPIFYLMRAIGNNQPKTMKLSTSKLGPRQTRNFLIKKTIKINRWNLYWIIPSKDHNKTTPVSINHSIWKFMTILKTLRGGILVRQWEGKISQTWETLVSGIAKGVNKLPRPWHLSNVPADSGATARCSH